MFFFATKFCWIRGCNQCQRSQNVIFNILANGPADDFSGSRWSSKVPDGKIRIVLVTLINLFVIV